MSRDDAIREWLRAKSMADQWATYEKQCREQLVAGCFDERDGTQRVDLGAGYGLKLLRTSRIKVDKGPKLFETMQRLHYVDVAGAAYVQNTLLKWTPETTLGRWNDTAPELREALSPLVTITPNSPQLSFEEPKK